MATFKVEVVRVDEVRPHPNADRLSLARVRGFQVVTERELYKAGDLAVYLPEQAVLPPPLLRALGVEGKLAGKEKNRVKAIRLRGELSQGMLFPLSLLDDLLEPRFRYQEQGVAPVSARARLGDDLSELLGVTKWEEPIPIHMAGTALPRPEWMAKYTEIENIKNFPDVFEEGEEVILSEKLHGSNVAIGFHRTQGLFVSSHNWCLQEDPGNAYWRMVREQGIEERLRRTLQENPDIEHMVIYGELLGVQDLKYGLTNGALSFRLFDVRVDGEFVDADLLYESGIPFLVPVLYQGPYSRDRVEEFTSGPSVVEGANHLREGAVIRPLRERYDPALGRVLLKSVSPDYLLRKKGTELR